MKCPNCDFESAPEMRFCGMCGTALTRTCSVCQFTNPLNYRFCGMCGSPLAEGAALPAYTRFSSQTEIQHLPSAVGAQAGAAETKSGLALEGERRVATILFADVKGSTELLEHLGTEAWVETMNNLFQAIEIEIYRYNGEVGQFRGDGLVAFFGAKSANEDDPQHAVMAALAIQEAIKPIAAELTRKEGIDLVMRVGVNTGEIIVASVGDAQYSEDTAMGEALAIAARMETSAEPGTVLVSESTYRLTRTDFEWQSLGEIHAKGFSHAMPVYRPLRHKPATDIEQEQQPLAEIGSAYQIAYHMIGRKPEYKQLKKCVDDLSTGRGGITIVTGVKGMGKSYLVNQVRQHFARQNVLLAAAQNLENPTGPDVMELTSGTDGAENKSILWLRARCRSYSNLRPYSMWLDLMHEWISAHPDDNANAVQEVFRTQMELQRGNAMERDYPNLATFLSAPSEESASERGKHLDAEGVKRLFFHTVRDWVKQMAERGPLVIAFADMQWADTTSIELLEYCLPLVDKQPILWILVYRQERSSPVWELQHRLETEYPHRLTHLNVPPLTTQETESFIDQVLGPDALRPETRELITRKAEGNPYFIKELIYALIAQGALAATGEGLWRQTRTVTSLDLPDSLQGLLMARIDRLEPTERRVLQMAAVIGSVFWSNVLQALAGPAIPEKQLQQSLVSLQRSGIIHERALIDDLGMEYAFDSSLIREVAYESLLNPQRVAYHQRVAEHLEEIIFREGKRLYFNTLAHHYKLAGDTKKELFYTLQAAERAQSIYANAEALHYYTRALELMERIDEMHPENNHQHYAILTQKFEALNGRRAVHFLIGNMEAGYADAQALLPLARQMEQDPTWLIDALLQQPGVSSAESREELIAGVPMANEALELAQRIGDKRREMNSLLAIASQRNLLNDPSWIDIGDRALELSREIGDRHYEAMILLALGHAYVGRDELQKGLEYLNAALPICQSLDDRVAEMILLRVLGSQHERSGDHYRRLVEFEHKRLEIAHEIGDRLEEGNALNFCGQIQALNLGDYEGGLALMRESERILDAVSGKIFTLLRIAQVQIALGQYEAAQETLESATPVAERNVFDLGRVGLRIVTILLYNALGDRTHLELALEMADEILQMEISQLISRQYRMAAYCESAAAHLGIMRLSSDVVERETHAQQALESSQKALETYEWFGYINIIECCSEEIYLRHSHALTANGRQEEAAHYLEMAYDEMMRKHAMIPADSPFRRTFLENIAVHREIRAAHTATTLAKIKGGRGPRTNA